jgi:hypothetical protein
MPLDTIFSFLPKLVDKAGKLIVPLLLIRKILLED